ncbi:PilZ domain-containing protein [Tautonia sociabilis]|nr:PilZ domain-containing protein [Tautonia sociabilis]
MSIDVIEMEARGIGADSGAHVGVERRETPRFTPLVDRLWLGWWDGEQFQTIGSQLIDISLGGAAIACTDGPETGDDAWFCVVGPRLSGGTRAQVVGREPMPGSPGVYRLRLRFLPRCPQDVFEIALGLLPGDSAEPALP